MKNVANENLSRRSFLRLAGVCAASVPGYASFARRPAGSASSQGRPNIIFLMSDDQRQKVLERSIRSKSVRTERYKYIRYFEQRPVIEELFDIRNDPIETFNLAENPEYSETLASLRKLCDDWIREAQ